MKKKTIKHDSYQDADTIKQYLQQIIDGLDKGKVVISNGEETIKLKPNGLLAFSLTASQGKAIQLLRFKIEWTPEDAESMSNDDDLIIE